MVIYDGEIIGLMIPGTDTARRALALLRGAGAGHEHARSFGIKICDQRPDEWGHAAPLAAQDPPVRMRSVSARVLRKILLMAG
jgi:hypothetical protein